MIINNIPQLLFLALMILSLGIDLSRHGEIIIRKENILTSLAAFGIINTILYFGGWFNSMLGK